MTSVVIDEENQRGYALVDSRLGTGGSRVAVLDLTTYSVVGVILLSSPPIAAAVNPRTNLLYVATERTVNFNAVYVIDTTTGIVVGEFQPFGRTAAAFLAIDVDKNRLYGAGKFHTDVWHRDLDTGSTVTLGRTNVISSFQLDTDRDRVYLDRRTNPATLDFLDAETGTPVRDPLTFEGSVTGIALNSGADRLYKLTADGVHVVIPSTGEALTRHVPLSPGATTSAGLAVDPLTHAVYVMTPKENRVHRFTRPEIAGAAGPWIAGDDVDFDYEITGNPAPSLEITAGSLPDGVTMTPEGKLTGKLARAGEFEFEITATNAVGEFSRTDIIKIVPRPEDAPRIAGAAGEGVLGDTIDFGYEVAGTPEPSLEMTAGSLPDGVVFTADGRLTGSLETVGTFEFEITATNAAGAATHTDTVTVTAIPEEEEPGGETVPDVGTSSGELAHTGSESFWTVGLALAASGMLAAGSALVRRRAKPL